MNLLLGIRTMLNWKSEQLYYKLIYNLRYRYLKLIQHKEYYNFYRKGLPLILNPFLPEKTSLVNKEICFVNKCLTYKKTIPWNTKEHGNEWQQQLLSFNFLNQENFELEKGLAVMYLFCDQLREIKNAKLPYSISKRSINWIKFISTQKIERKTLDRYLYSELRLLLSNIQYNKGGYELLENGIALLFGAYYFKGNELMKEAKIILSRELNEQILSDGAHFQKCPRKHIIIVLRLLDAYNLMRNNSIYDDIQLQELIQKKCKLMLAFLNQIKFKSGSIPNFNDSFFSDLPTLAQILNYAESIGIIPDNITLSTSGFRKFTRNNFEAIIDVGKIGPSYALDYTHAACLHFILQKNKKDFIVDTGFSSLDEKTTRVKERATIMHNTVSYNFKNQLEIWGLYRVGRCPEVKLIEDDPCYVKAKHTGFKHLGVIHERHFFAYANALEIIDIVQGDFPDKAKSYLNLHFHPDVQKVVIDVDKIYIDGSIIETEGEVDVKISDYYYSADYNTRVLAKKIEISFYDKLITKIFV